MYTLLIVEDEEEIREGIAGFIEGETDSFLIRTARNGARALETIRSERIDAMILDIRMPVMDGVSLLAELKRQNITIATVIMSGHDEFEYAKTALEYGAIKYVLKPVTPADILHVVLEIKDFLDEKGSRNAEIELLRKQVRENIHLLKERLFVDILSNRVDTATFRSKAEYFGLNLRHGGFQVAILDIPQGNSASDVERYEMMIQSVENELTDFMHKACDFEAFHFASEQIVLLFSMADGTGSGVILDRLASILKVAGKVSGTEITIGVGGVYKGVEGIRRSYIEAAKSVKHQIIMGSGSILCYWKINTGDEVSDPSFDPDEFKMNLKLCQRDQAKSTILQAFEEFSSRGSKIRLDSIYSFASFAVASVASLLSECGKSISDVFPDHINPYEVVFRLNTMEDIRDWVLRLIDVCTDYMTELRAGKSKNVVEMAKKIIHENYSDDITTGYLSERLFLNQDYLGRIFKAETGLSVSDYLNKVRIGKAKELLRETNLMVYEVALKVGFNDQHYFSTVFRKIAGVTPSRYKEA